VVAVASARENERRSEACGHQAKGGGLIKVTGRGVAALLALVSLLAAASPAAAAANTDTVVFAVPLSGVDPEGTGTAVLRFDQTTGELCYDIVVRGIGEPTEPQPGLGSAHIHLRATGGIAVHLDADFAQAGAADVFLASNCVQVDAATLEAILADPSAFYVNIHTVEFPGGAIEGTLG
jgi:CHRD domain